MWCVCANVQFVCVCVCACVCLRAHSKRTKRQPTACSGTGRQAVACAATCKGGMFEDGSRGRGGMRGGHAGCREGRGKDLEGLHPRP